MSAFDPSPPDAGLCDDHSQVKPCKFCAADDAAFDRAFASSTDKERSSFEMLEYVREALIAYSTASRINFPIIGEITRHLNRVESAASDTRSAGEGREPTKEQRQALNDLFMTMCSKLARGEEINWLAMPHEVWRALKEAGDYVPVAQSASEGRRDDNDELNRLSGPGIRKA